MEKVDRNVEAIRQRLKERADVGLKKYGVTTEREDLSFEDWLTHLQEELLDGAVYIERLKATRPREAALEVLLHRACKMLATLGDQMDEHAEDRHEIEAFQLEAAAALAAPAPEGLAEAWREIETAPKGPSLELLFECSGYEKLAVWGPFSYDDEGNLWDDQTGDKIVEWTGAPRFWRLHVPPALAAHGDGK